MDDIEGLCNSILKIFLESDGNPDINDIKILLNETEFQGMEEMVKISVSEIYNEYKPSLNKKPVELICIIFGFLLTIKYKYIGVYLIILSLIISFTRYGIYYSKKNKMMKKIKDEFNALKKIKKTDVEEIEVMVYDE